MSTKENDIFLESAVDKWLQTGDVRVLRSLKEMGYTEEAVRLWENDNPEHVVDDMDDDSDIEIEQRLDAEDRDLQRQADIHINGY